MKEKWNRESMHYETSESEEMPAGDGVSASDELMVNDELLIK